MTHRFTVRAATALTLGMTLLLALGTAACQGGPEDDPCLNKRTEVSPTGARHVLDVPLPFEPGPLAVVSASAQGVQVSRSSRLWLGEGGLSLYALHGAGVWRMDLATLDLSRVGGVDRQAEQLAGSGEDDTLIVTDSAQGAVWILDQTRLAPPVRIPLGGVPTAVALGPGRRLAYVANPGDWSLSLVETGVGVASPAERSLLVASASEGILLRLDGDGRTRARFAGLPAHLADLLVVDEGRTAVASYSELLITGNIGTIGDGDLVLDEGIVTVDLEDGTVERFPLPRSAKAGRAGALASPAGLEDLGDGTVAVALPGWATVAVVDLGAGSATRGQVLRELAVPGQPRWLVRAALAEDWLYVLDDDGATLSVVDATGQVARQLTLR